MKKPRTAPAPTPFEEHGHIYVTAPARVCSWCSPPRLIGEDGAPGEVWDGQAGATHGLCAPCEARTFAEIEGGEDGGAAPATRIPIEDAAPLPPDHPALRQVMRIIDEDIAAHPEAWEAWLVAQEAAS